MPFARGTGRTHAIVSVNGHSWMDNGYGYGYGGYGYGDNNYDAKKFLTDR